VYGTDYTASPPAKDDTGGTLTLLTELPAGAADILIRRKTPVTQEIELHDNSRIHAKTIEEMADKVTMEVQEIRNSEVNKDDLQNVLRQVNDVVKSLFSIFTKCISSYKME
jgi:copper(I)-binding protein